MLQFCLVILYLYSEGNLIIHVMLIVTMRGQIGNTALVPGLIYGWSGQADVKGNLLCGLEIFLGTIFLPQRLSSVDAKH